MHIKWCNHQFFQTRITSKAGKGVKHSRHFLGQLRFAGEQTEVGINACSP